MNFETLRKRVEKLVQPPDEGLAEALWAARAAFERMSPEAQRRHAEERIGWSRAEACV